jgi:hypothetical protein
MLKAPLVCDRNGNNLLMVESASPLHKPSQGNCNVFPRPQIKVEKDEDSAKDEEDLKTGEDSVVQKCNSSADDKLRASTAHRVTALGRTSVSGPHVTAGRRTSAKLTRNAVPAAFIQQQMRTRRTRTPTGEVRDVQCWTSNFQLESDNKNVNKE